MHLKDHDLRQIDAERLQRTQLDDPEALEDLKSTRERLNQNHGTGSRLPSSRAPWSRTIDDDEDEQESPGQGAAFTEEPAPDAQANSDETDKLN